MEKQKSNKVLIGILIAIIVVLLCAIVYLLVGKDKSNDKTVDDSTTTTTIVNDNNDKDVTDEMKLKLNGLWYNKEQNLYFRINNNNYQKGEFATDAVINCKIVSIKLLNSGKYQLNVNNCTFAGEKIDDEVFEITYNEINREILENGIKYKLTDENELYNN